MHRRSLRRGTARVPPPPRASAPPSPHCPPTRGCVLACPGRSGRAARLPGPEPSPPDRLTSLGPTGHDTEGGTDHANQMTVVFLAEIGLDGAAEVRNRIVTGITRHDSQINNSQSRNQSTIRNRPINLQFAITQSIFNHQSPI